ncbi:unnamed protein product [Arabidopsis thaliana]|uniref:F-box associated beta-propeller type 3 domain-containing protein n=1 Tax=Arabidopsis thaliana TaxID=3702 RepID=A0A654FWS9_ARATH|nr:unnamed protein product [Arabidopsis thaliana]
MKTLGFSPKQKFCARRQTQRWLPEGDRSSSFTPSTMETQRKKFTKLWASIIRDPYFMKLFLNESLKRPKSLVFVFRAQSLGSIFSSVHLKSTREISSSSSSSSASSITYHVTCYTQQRMTISPSVHGLICYGPPSSLVIYNPCTRRSITLPKIKAGRRAINQYIGYDPLDGNYKVVCITRGMPMLRNRRGLAEEIQVLTLGTRDSSWRMIHDIIPPHSPVSEELCINGVLYYRAFIGTKLNESAIMSFDVRSEKFDLIKVPCNFRSFSKLAKYEGKLAVIFYEKKTSGIIGLWILEDASNGEWSKKTFALPNLAASSTNSRILKLQKFRTTDADTCEIIFTPSYAHSSLSSAIYCDLKENKVRKFVKEGWTENYLPCNADSVSSTQVENLMFL